MNKSCRHFFFPLFNVTRHFRVRAAALADAPEPPAVEVQPVAVAPDSIAPAPLAAAPPKPRRTRTPRCVTVDRRFRYTSHPKGEIVPLLRLSGRWLEERGFSISGNVYVEAGEAG